MLDRRRQPTLVTVLAAMSLAACQAAAPPAPAPAPAVANVSPGVAPVVDVTTVDYAFRAPDAISSGWTTIRLRNEGEEHHMAFLSRLPEGKTVEDYESEVSSEFSRAWQAVKTGRATPDEALAALFAALPEWFPDLQLVGGPGIVAPGAVSEVTINLEPGNYVVECYVKTPDGEVHYMEGMIRPIVVSERRSDATIPTPDIRVTLSNFDMAVEGDLSPGKRTVAVHAAENPEQGFGHSVHVARLDAGTSVQDVVEWLNWFAPGGYRAPAPARFLGGLHPLPTGKTGYFTVDLEPGRYVLVSEATGAQGVVKEVTVR